MGNFRGNVEAVHLSARTGRLEAINLASGGGVIENGRVPVNAIESSDGNLVRVREPWNELEPLRQGPEISLKRGARVMSADGKRLGSLRSVCFDPVSGLVGGLIVDGGRSRQTVLLPLERLKAAGPDRLLTDLRTDQWTSLQPFATDEAIRASILARFEEDSSLRPFVRSLTVEVKGQRVRLAGFVRSQAEAEQAAEAARSVPGVLAVDRELRSDEELVGAVREAIERDLGTSASEVEVKSAFGQVDIFGRVHDRQTLHRIDAAASRVPGVLVMHNLVTVG